MGGHLNPVDDGEDPLPTGCAGSGPRSWLPTGSREFRLVGLLNDDSNPVGSVHLGVVFEVEAAGRPVERAGARQADADAWPMRPRSAAAWERMETWSRLVADRLL